MSTSSLRPIASRPVPRVTSRVLLSCLNVQIREAKLAQVVARSCGDLDGADFLAERLDALKQERDELLDAS